MANRSRLSGYCPECGAKDCAKHNGNGIKSEVKTQQAVGEIVHKQFENDIKNLDKDIKHLHKDIDNKIKFAIMTTLAVVGAIGGVTFLDEQSVRGDIDNIELKIEQLTKQVTQVESLHGAILDSRLRLDDIVEVERRIMQEISELRADIERLK